MPFMSLSHSPIKARLSWQKHVCRVVLPHPFPEEVRRAIRMFEFISFQQGMLCMAVGASMVAWGDAIYRLSLDLGETIHVEWHYFSAYLGFVAGALYVASAQSWGMVVAARYSKFVMYCTIVFGFTLSTVHAYAGAYIAAVNQLNSTADDAALQRVTDQILVLYSWLCVPMFLGLLGSFGTIFAATIANRANVPRWTALVNPLIIALVMGIVEKWLWYGLRSAALGAVPFSILMICVWRAPAGEDGHTPLFQ